MKKGRKVMLIVIGLLAAGLYLSPFYIMLVNSFKTKRQLFLDTLGLPDSFNIDNYILAWQRLDFLRVFANSLIITVASIALIIIFSSMAGWMLERTKTKLSNFIFFLFIAAMLIPFQSVMLPLIRIMGKLNFLNIPGLIFMYLGFGSSLSIFLYHGFVKSVPKSLDEAAIIDGCNYWQTYWYIILPILKPISVTVAILNSTWIWNDYLLPSLVINREDTHTIPLRIFFFFGEYTKQWNLAMAGLVLAIIPVIVFYFFSQKHIIKSFTEGSIK
ncbi:ABC transporter permease subunit [Iocasia frigidifontis]|uniref:ABC transporter permease subunit n=1 Tax=Iocasia fonsfrigidae TaxID=2682810 RepID=A0A8A7KHY3_9FIRM|nr:MULTISPECIES: carbohydrate ABC transporter permease [Halanaerobiaceae]AZO96421.1 carbohydrate ABC transporter permease [Halocella sp. SP3-1]QTL99169.1 ABC transporter permease subunit [Iocasia fonsfrigidae]